MANVTVIEHPLIQHKLTIMRSKETSTASFRPTEGPSAEPRTEFP